MTLPQAPNHWPVIHLRSVGDPRVSCCGRRPVATLLTVDWGTFTCGSCLIPYRPGPLDPRSA